MSPRHSPDLGSWLDARLAARGERPAFGDKTKYRLRRLSYAGFRARVAACRAGLQRRGVRAGDAVILLGRNGSWWASALVACLESAVVAVPLDEGSDQGLLSRVARETRARLLITDRADLSGPPSLRFEELARAGSAAPPPPLAAAGPDAVAEVLYTSGSTGAPKGVILTRGNLLASIQMLLGLVPPLPGLRLLSTLPLSHVLEQTAGLLLPLAAGWQVIYPDSVRPARLAGLIRDEGVNALISVPGILEGIRRAVEAGGRRPRAALGWRLWLVGVGGASLPEPLERWWRARGVRVVQGYGLTETAALIASNSAARTRVGSVGRPLPGVELRLAPDGEIQARGPQLSPGYFGDEGRRELYTPDGWLKTGDIGELRGGWLYVRGRKKEVIVTSSGANVHASDVETALRAEPGVRDACVLQRHDRVWAVLLMQPGADAAAAVRRANAGLLAHQRVAGTTLWPEADFPRTPTRKVRGAVVEERLDELERSRAEIFERPAPSDPLRGLILRILGRPEELSAGTTLGDAGMDSLRRLELSSALKDELGVEVSEEHLTESLTIGELESLIERRERKPRLRFPAWQTGALAAPLRGLLRPLLIGLVRAFARPRVAGLEHLAGLSGPVVFAANHQSAWDAPLVLSSLPRRFRRAAVPALPDFWRRGRGWRRWRPLVGWLIGPAVRAYPFGPEAGMEAGLELTGRLADRGLNIVLFPEGARTRDGRMQAFRPGVGVLSKELGLPVVPVLIRGMRELVPAPRLLPRRRGRVTVRFGAALRAAPDAAPEEFTAQVRRSVERLAGPSPINRPGAA